MSNYALEIREILRKHDGLSKSELAMALILARVELLHFVVLHSSYQPHGEELRVALDASEKSFPDYLEASLQAIEGLMSDA
jgi:hypothetical protein